jgi:hypothetical protein
MLSYCSIKSICILLQGGPSTLLSLTTIKFKMTKAIPHHNIKRLAVPLLVILLLMAPCSFRNTVQTIFGVEKTKPLNPNKTTLSQTHCSVWEKVTQKTLSSKKLTHKLFLQSAATCRAIGIRCNDDSLALIRASDLHATLPYYILYQRMKVYDLNDMRSV